MSTGEVIAPTGVVNVIKRERGVCEECSYTHKHTHAECGWVMDRHIHSWIGIACVEVIC